MPGQENQISVALRPVQQPSSSRAHAADPPAENLAREIVAWVVASDVGQQETEGRGPLGVVCVQVLELEMGGLVRLALLQHALRVRETGTGCEDLDHVA